MTSSGCWFGGPRASSTPSSPLLPSMATVSRAKVGQRFHAERQLRADNPRGQTSEGVAHQPIEGGVIEVFPIAGWISSVQAGAAEGRVRREGAIIVEAAMGGEGRDVGGNGDGKGAGGLAAARVARAAINRRRAQREENARNGIANDDRMRIAIIRRGNVVIAKSAVGAGVKSEIGRAEIGRASCRERV